MHQKVIDVITADISKLFDLNSSEVFNLRVEYGMKYIEARYKEAPEIGIALSKNPAFWGWWCELWAERDRELIKRCERYPYGLRYTFLMNGYVGSQRMRDTRAIMNDDRWDFYTDFHYWQHVKLYPNETLISSSMMSHAGGEKQLINQ